MERRCNYPIEIKAKIDLNTDLLLTELQQLLGKDRSKLLRLILADFFNRNIDIIDEHTNHKSDKATLIEAILKDFFDSIEKLLTNTLNSKMIRPPKSVLLQYVYDYGLDKAAALFHIDTETADKIINWKPQYDQYSYNTVIDKPLHRNASKIADIIAKHYPELVKQYTTYYKDTIYMSQTVEDFLQKAVIRCMEVGLEDVTEESVLELLRVQFNTIRCYAKKSSYTMNSKLVSLEVQNEEGEYIIPAELYAISKEAE